MKRLLLEAQASQNQQRSKSSLADAWADKLVSSDSPQSPAWPSTRRRALKRIVSMLIATPGLGAALAANTPVRLIVPVPPGGGMDVTARVLAERLRQVLGTVIVENKPGASLRLGIQAVRAAAADGSVLLYAPTSPFTIFPHVYPQLGYDAEADFIPIASTASFEFALSTSTESGIDSVDKFLERARTDPNRFGLYGVPGVGTGAHFVGAALAQATGVELTNIPYRGSAPLIQDLLGGQIVAACNVLGEFTAAYSAKKLNVLATTGRSRSSLVPDVPTFAELGLPNLVFDEEFGLFAPKGTPTELIQRLSSTVRQALGDQEVQRRFFDRGYFVRAMDSDELARKLAEDRKRWGPIVKKTGFSLSSSEEVIKRGQ